MKKKNLTFAVLTLSLCGACTTGPYQQDGQNVIIPLQPSDASQARMVRLEVLGEKLIHVSATPELSFADPQSLIIVPQEQKTPYSVTQNGDTIKVATEEICARVLTTTGEVSFADKNGKVILAEPEGGCKTFTPIEVDGTKGYSIRQTFTSPEDEALYGLGQHQADEFNYKGKNEELYQYNTKVSIPFIVSNKNYGVLLDSYSLCRFGNPNDYNQLNHLFTLHDKEGVEGALTGTYEPAKGETIVRREDSIYFENLKTIKNLPKGFPLYNSKVTYEGTITAKESGPYKFILYYAGYMTVNIGGKEVVPERWRTAWNPNSYKFEVTLEAGQPQDIRIDWRPDGGESYCGLRAMAPVADEIQYGQHTWWSEMTPQLDYYFIAGDDIDEVIAGYRTLTGKAQIMPRWAMGYWQSRERYKTADELLTALAEFRRRQIPIDNIVLDWNYWPEDAWGSHDFDATRFPDPKGMVDSVHAMNAHIMISVWPKFYITTEHYKEFEKNGWMYMQSVKDSLRDWIGHGYHYGFYDAYSEGARKLFWQQMQEKLYPLGFDAWWMDASEPNVRDCTDLPYRKALCGPTALGPSDQYFNAYALMNADAIYNGQREVDPDKRVFLLTRSGFAGLQRYSTATWSGDIATRWEDLKAQISAGLNFSISGVPYWTMDIGGFCVEKRYEQGQHIYNKTGQENADHKEWRELNTRWYQFGAFAPLFRAHGQYPFREIWNIAPEGHPAYKSIAYYTRLRYRLMPYIYSMAGMTWFEDYTIMRPFIMDFAHDSQVNNIGDQYMFGHALMVAPVYTYGARSREVYFPKTEGGWYDFYTGATYEGGTTIEADAPYERMPLYVRAGAIIPYGPEIQYADEKPADKIDLHVYAGADGAFTLYEDENDNYGYEEGRYAMIPFKYDHASQTLTIGKRTGSFPGMLNSRTFNIVWKQAAQQGQEKTIEVLYDGEEQVVKLNP